MGISLYTILVPKDGFLDFGKVFGVNIRSIWTLELAILNIFTEK